MEIEDEIRQICKSTLAEALGIEILSASKELVSASMPVDSRTIQPAGLLHGGASVALAETIASIGGQIHTQQRGKNVVGQEINANHLRPVKSGKVIGSARPIHLGKNTQVWEILIKDEKQRLVCISRCTLHVI